MTSTITCALSVCVHSPVPVSIFLIDHAWTYQLEFAHQQLLQIPGLASRMSRLMGLVDEDEERGDGEDIEGEDAELEEEKEEEEEEEENQKESGEEAQAILKPLVAGHAAVADTKVAEVKDILKELWR